jgi:hypothetical protein
VDDRDVRLNAILDWLESGRITVDQAVRRIAAMRFPAPPEKTDYQEKVDDAIGDPEVPQPGSPFAISEAHASGRIDDQQYEALAQAAAEAMNHVSGS